MVRVIQFACALLGGVLAVLAALLVPVHLRAVDPRVLELTGRGGRSLVEVASERADRNPAVAKLLLHAAEELHLPGTEAVVDQLRASAEKSARAGGTILQQLEARAPDRVPVLETPVVAALRPREARDQLRQSIKGSEGLRLLQNLNLTNLSLFAPVRSAAGLPLEVAILTSAFLMEQGAFNSNGTGTSSLHDDILLFSASPARSRELEEFYLDILALTRRFSSEQLIAFVSSIQDFDSVERLARTLQEYPRDLPIIYSAVLLSRSGRAVSQYLQTSGNAVRDLGFALSNGTRAVSELLETQHPVYRAEFHNELLADRRLAFLSTPLLRLAAASTVVAFGLKVLFLFVAGVALAFAFRLAQSPSTETDAFVPRFGLARRLTFAGVFLALMLLLGEPYLARSAESAEENRPTPQISLNLLAALGNPNPQPTGPMVNSSVLIAMGVFFVLQSSIYLVCLTKLAEIRRQSLSSGMKLRLMENEENLFDAGLYLGLFGTAASLILLTLGLIKPSLVSAYSSTLFGILFVAVLKIFHVRPYKRRLILESAAEPQ